jgi:kinesin family protein 5
MSNIKVVCRVRPLGKKEKKKNTRSIIGYKDENTMVVSKKDFIFDRVFREKTTQSEIYEDVAINITDDILDGYNCTVIAYGLTGTGKTYTMMGSKLDEGIIPRLVYNLFDSINETNEDIEYTIQVSYLEIYLEKIRDLLNTKHTNLRIRESPYKGIWVQGLTDVYATTTDEIFDIIDKGNNNRSIAETKMNPNSSRSHSIFSITVTQVQQSIGTKTISKLVLVDLAGSESVEKTGASGLTLTQSQYTNKSLLTLGYVIRNLHQHSGHIPYRDSKLTRILTNSLGGNSKTLLIVTCSPFSEDSHETLSTLRFGTTVKTICNTPKVNTERSIGEYKRLLAEANKKLSDLGECGFVEGLESEDILRFKEISDENEKLREENEKLKETMLFKDVDISESTQTFLVNFAEPASTSRHEKLSKSRGNMIKFLEKAIDTERKEFRIRSTEDKTRILILEKALNR